jgi:hypothetical protein
LQCNSQKKLVDLEPFVVGESCTNFPNQSLINKTVKNTTTATFHENIDIETTTHQQKQSTSSDKTPLDANKQWDYIQKVMEEDEAFSQKLQERHEQEQTEAKNVAASPSVSTTTPVIRNKRLAELNPRTPQTPITPSSSNPHNISELVMEFPTPNREVLYKLLKEIESKETPQTRRFKRLIATPGKCGSDETPSPTIPKELRTPDEVWGFRPDASPRNHMFHKRQFEAMDVYYRPPVAKTSDKPETPVRIDLENK